MTEQRVIIEHKDGRRYSVTKDGFTELGYKSAGFKVVGPDGDPEPYVDDSATVEPKADDSK